MPYFYDDAEARETAKKSLSRHGSGTWKIIELHLKEEVSRLRLCRQKLQGFPPHLVHKWLIELALDPIRSDVVGLLHNFTLDDRQHAWMLIEQQLKDLMYGMIAEAGMEIPTAEAIREGIHREMRRYF